MTIRKLYYMNARRKKAGLPPLSGEKWGLTLAPQVGKTQTAIEKTCAYTVKRPVKKRDEKIARLTESKTYTNHSNTSLWVHNNRSPLDRKWQGFTLRELQTVGKSATPAHLQAMTDFLNR